MLQMQAEAWRMQWSVAMQENEELRAKLYDTRNSLEAAGGGGGSPPPPQARKLGFS